MCLQIYYANRAGVDALQSLSSIQDQPIRHRSDTANLECAADKQAKNSKIVHIASIICHFRGRQRAQVRIHYVEAPMCSARGAQPALYTAHWTKLQMAQNWARGVYRLDRGACGVALMRFQYVRQIMNCPIRALGSLIEFASKFTLSLTMRFLPCQRPNPLIQSELELMLQVLSIRMQVQVMHSGMGTDWRVVGRGEGVNPGAAWHCCTH